MSDEPEELDRYLDDFGLRLYAAAASPAPWPRRRLALLATPAVAAAVLAAVLLVGTGGERLDVVAEARAALSPPDAIVHMVIREDPGPGAPPPPPIVTEQWAAVDPLRWRVVHELPSGTAFGVAVEGQDGYLLVGHVEQSYADGVRRAYRSKPEPLLRVTKGLSDEGPAARVSSPQGAFGGPQVDLRAMLASGEVRDAGEHRLDGRPVRRLVGEPGPDLYPPGTSSGTSFVYDVDPETFAPVRYAIDFPEPIGPDTEYFVDVYERIPLTPETAQLLEIQTPPDTEVVEREPGQWSIPGRGPVP